VTAPPPTLAAALADRYRLERELGQGGMATVYLGHDLRHDRKVAVKVLRPELAAVLGAQRFLNEVRITARLDHPHILTLIDSGETAGFLWYVLPYIRGESLRDRLRREKQLGVEEALAITRQVAGALDYAHHQGVVHRDIKPENILLHEGEAMVADFGIALAVREAGGPRLTETGLSLGTPQYMSPEQATGDRELDARSDLYSLAAVLYEMLAGEPPHSGPTVQAIIAKLMTERPTRLRTVRDTVPEGIDNAVARALAKVPADRFANVAEFAHALTARPTRIMSEPSSGRRWMVPALGALALIGVALTVVLLRRSPDRVIQPDRVQLTFTGNARTPALSADGKRLAYSTRQCDSIGHCTTDVVLQDLGGAGSTTLLRGWASIEMVEWTGDGRYLLVRGFEGAAGNWGVFAVPSLGGTPRFLGRGKGHLVGTSDTALIYHPPVGDSVARIHWITLADGVVRDSLSVLRGAVRWSFDAVVLPGGRRLLAWRWSRAGWTAVLIDRTGRQLDSLLVTDPRVHPIGPSGDGAALLMMEGDPFELGAEAFNVLAYRIRGAGKFALRPDTILSGLEGYAFVAPDGSLLLASGPVRHQVWALERARPAAMVFRQRLLASWTSRLIGEVSPDGNRVLLNRRTVAAGASRQQVSLIPFDGGPEQAIDAPPDALAASWNGDGSGLFLYSFRGQDSIAGSEIDLASGRAGPVHLVSWREVNYEPARLPGGGLLLPLINPPGIRRVGTPGRTDTTFLLPEGWSASAGLAPSPDGSAVGVVGWSASGDSVLVARLSLNDGSLTQLASFYPQDVGEPFWLTDNTLIVPILETAATLAWYRVPIEGGTPKRLGSPPRFPAEYNLSRDGRRVIANTSEDSPDVYVIRNFARLLEH
jgi:tRNA A-37 threonylcarbamoyl transferase component Bud32